MFEHDLLDFYAFDLRKPVSQLTVLALVAEHFQEDQASWRADVLVDVVQPDAGLDVAAVFGERLLYELDVADAVVDVNAENHVPRMHGKLLCRKEVRIVWL